MILNFRTRINDKPSYFVEKIHKGFSLKELNMRHAIDPRIHYPKDYNYVVKGSCKSKIHTIREDKKNRWRKGVKIDFFIHARTEIMFRFAPVLPVISTQKIAIEWRSSVDDRNIKPVVWVDDNMFYDQFFNYGNKKMLELAQNDGFDSIEEFFLYFNKDYTGKIVHWTSNKY